MDTEDDDAVFERLCQQVAAGEDVLLDWRLCRLAIERNRVELLRRSKQQTQDYFAFMVIDPLFVYLPCISSDNLFLQKAEL
jgi:hypothetical protein